MGRIQDVLASEYKWINQQDIFGMTALHYAAAEGNEPIFRLLLDSGANPQIKDFNGETVIHKFARVNINAPIQYLELKGLSLDQSNKRGDTPLHIAASQWNAPQVQRFIERGANPNIQNYNGKSALHIAVERFPSKDSINVNLLKNELKKERDTTKIGYWLLTKRKFKNSWKSVQQFFKKIPEKFSPPPPPLLNSDEGIKTVELLLNSDIKLHLRDTDKQTALAIAKKKNHYQLTKFLIKRGLFKESDY